MVAKEVSLCPWKIIDGSEAMQGKGQRYSRGISMNGSYLYRANINLYLGKIIDGRVNPCS